MNTTMAITISKMSESIPPNLMIAIAIALALVAARLTRSSLFFLAKVSSTSMHPSLKPKQSVLARHLHSFARVRRGDIVIFYSHELDQNLIKRVIGFPGDKIDIRENGAVFINQAKLSEHYVKKSGGSGGSFSVPPGKCFLLGDNRTVSQDSRHFKDPYIAQEDIIGKAVVSLYPFHKL